MSFSQLYQGPAAGSVAGGVIVSTQNFSDEMPENPLPPYLVKGNQNEGYPELYPDYINKIKATGPEGSNFCRDLSVNTDNPPPAPSLLVKNYPGVPRTAYLPPDAHIAVGPTHVIGAVNSTFRIWDINGNVIQTINASSWLSSLGLGIGSSVSDPKIAYDHFAKRWIMTWITPPIGPLAYDVISVSDDSIPIGQWVNYAMRTDLNGSTPVDLWRDYQGVGFDQNALYITGNGFTISSSSFIYSTLRIINKSMLYANNAGPVNWFDIWDIKDASNFSTNFGIRPGITFGTPSEFYLICNANVGTGTYVSLYKLINPLSSPSMTGVAVPVTTYTPPPSSGQQGTTVTITAGGTSGFRNEPVYRNGFLHAVHAVRNGNYSGFKYYKINVATNTAEQDVVFGAPDYYYSYPALMVDQNQNVLVTYSRSGTFEYIGAQYTSRLNTDPPNTFNPSSILQSGKGTIINSGSSNRWGDYMGSWLTPSGDEFYIHTEYADLNNNWGVWVGNVRLIPYSNASIHTNIDSLSYGNIEVGTVSDTHTVKILNFGNTALNINSINSTNNEFQILNLPSLPVTLNFGDSILLKVRFVPSSAGVKRDSMQIASNDPANPVKKVHLRAKGFAINPVSSNLIYGVTGAQSGGSVLSINSGTGSGTTLGASGFTQLNGVSVHPSTGKLFAINTGSPASNLVRVNATGGDAYLYKVIPFANLRAIAFDLNDELYCSSSDGKIYKYNINSGDTLTIGNSTIPSLLGLSINPVNGQMWGMSATGGVYKINKQNASSQLIGNTEQTPNSDLAFDKLGKLYGIKGVGVTVNSLITIDTSNGTGSLIGSIGIAGINGIAISPDIVGINNVTSSVPDNYELYQNFPNPFNPVTNIKFALKQNGFVSLKVYDNLGRLVETLVNENLNAGVYSTDWNAVNFSSGVYFYKLETEGFLKTMRMILIK